MNPPDSLRDRLTHEAAAARPPFSESLHDRVMYAVSSAARDPAPARLAWPRYAAAAAAIILAVSLTAIFTTRDTATPPVAAQPMLPVITIRIAMPQVPDIDREARRTLRLAAFAAGQLLEAGPIPIVINEPSRE